MYRYSTPTIPIKMIDLDFSEVAFFRIKMENDKTSILQQIEINDSRVDAGVPGGLCCHSGPRKIQ